MAVISIPNRKTDSRDIYERYKTSDKSMFYTDAQHIEEFSIELTIGDSWAEIIDKDAPDMYSFDGGVAVLKPNCSVVVEVAEEIKAPFNVYGIIVPTGRAFLEKGIIIGAGKIEPSFEGKLKILLYNTSKSKRDLIPGTKLGSAIFFRTERTLSAKLPLSSKAVNIKRKGRFESIIGFISSDPKFFIREILTVLTSSLMASIVTVFIMSKEPILEVKNQDDSSIEQNIEGP